MLIVPLQLNFIVIIEVLFKFLIMMSSMNVLNILRLIVTSFIIIYFMVHSHFNLFPFRVMSDLRKFQFSKKGKMVISVKIWNFLDLG